MLDEAIEYLKQLQLQVQVFLLTKIIYNQSLICKTLSFDFDHNLMTCIMQTLAVMNGLGLNPMRLPPVPPTQTRINETLEPELNLETLLGASHSLAHREPPQASQEMCFSTATLL